MPYCPGTRRECLSRRAAPPTIGPPAHPTRVQGGRLGQQLPTPARRGRQGQVNARQPSRRWWGIATVGLLALLAVGGVVLARALAEPLDSPLLAPFQPALPRPGGRIATIWQRGIWLVDPTTTSRERIASNPQGRLPSQVAWAPDGSRLAISLAEYVAGQALGIGGLYVLPAGGGAETRVLSEGQPGAVFDQPSWTPDGA